MAKSAFFTGPLYEKMSEDLYLTGKSKRNHDGYLREIRKLAEFCQRTPDRISEDQVRRYFLHLKNERHFAAGSLTVTLSSFKFSSSSIASRHRPPGLPGRWLACAALGLFFLLRFGISERPSELPPLTCSHCGGDLKLVMITFIGGTLLLNHRQPFLDSG